jgi:DivIVA domain-containing protein
MSSDPQPDVAGIGQRQFSSARRGYDADEVRNYLRELAAWAGGLQRREAEARERADQAEARARKAEQLDEHRLVEILGEETARVLDAARAAATDIRSKSEESAARLISEANHEAHRLKAEGEAVVATQRLELLGEVEGLRDEAATELDRRRADGEQIAAEMRREAQSECDAMRQDGEKKRTEAEARADEIRAQAREEGRQLVAEAQLVRSRVLGDLARRRHTAREQLERLHGARERLLAAYEVVRRTADEATAELTVVLPEAKIAGDMAMRRVEREPEPSVEQLENMVAMARITGLIDEAADPVFGDDGYEPTDEVGIDGVAGVEIEVDGVDADGVQVEADELEPADEDDDIDIDIDIVDVLVVGTAGGVGVYDVEAEPFEDDDDLGPVVEVEVGVQVVEVAPTSPPPPVTVYVPAPEAPAEDELELDEAGDDELVGDDPWLDDGSDHSAEQSEDDVVGDHGDWVVDDDPPATSAVDALFARLKAGRQPVPVEEQHADHDDEDLDHVGYDDTYESYEDASDQGEQPAEAAGDYDFEPEMATLAGPAEDGDDVHEANVEAEATAADEGDDESGEAEPEPVFEDLDPDEATLRLRDGNLGPLEHEMGRKLKRVLSNEQNEVLDLLRRTKARTLDELMPEGGDAHAARYSDAALEGLTAAAAWGAASVEGKVKGSCQPLAEQLGHTVVEPLRARMARSFTDAGGDVEEVTNRLRALYREWKGHHIAAAVQHYAVAAYAQGAYNAMAEGTPVRWLVDRGGDACPDADDNALAGRVCKGEAFPTGDRHPPAHLGCRCLAVPLDWPRRN